MLPATAAQGIYSCVDARGRNLTSDRPIAECNDREQRELNPSGTTRRRVEPTYSAVEQAERDAREREVSQHEGRLAEDRRRDRALLVRYPNPQAHERSREEALAQIEAVTNAASKRVDELATQRKEVASQMEFYKKDPTKAPAPLRRLFENNAQSIAAQGRFVSEQEDEKKRVNARFDDERIKLRPLWVAAGTAPR